MGINTRNKKGRRGEGRSDEGRRGEGRSDEGRRGEGRSDEGRRGERRKMRRGGWEQEILWLLMLVGISKSWQRVVLLLVLVLIDCTSPIHYLHEQWYEGVVHKIRVVSFLQRCFCPTQQLETCVKRWLTEYLREEGDEYELIDAFVTWFSCGRSGSCCRSCKRILGGTENVWYLKNVVQSNCTVSLYRTLSFSIRCIPPSLRSPYFMVLLCARHIWIAWSTWRMSLPT